MRGAILRDRIRRPGNAGPVTRSWRPRRKRREHYDTLRAELINHLSPVIVIQNDDQGGLYTLVHNGEQESLHPVSEIFELAKSIAHVPLGSYSIVAPYLSHRLPDLPGSARLDQHDVDMVAFKGPGAKGRVGPLRDFGTTLTTARQQLGSADLPRRLEAASGRILDGALGFIDESVERGHFDMESFENFAGPLRGVRPRRGGPQVRRRSSRRPRGSRSASGSAEDRRSTRITCSEFPPHSLDVKHLIRVGITR
ncbi:hypothetical protein ACVWXU_005353 [Streptomyces sp. TE33382]